MATGPFEAVTTDVDPEFAVAVTLVKTCFPASSDAKTYEPVTASTMATQVSGMLFRKLSTEVAHRYH
jgi:hypothetical protein